jgi:hypothetical protein
MTACSQCGTLVEPDDRFCGGCGAPVGTSTPTAGSPAGDAPLPPPPSAAPRQGPPQLVTAGEGVRALTTRGFFASLFDMSFTSLVTTKIIEILIALEAIAWIVIAFSHSSALGVLTLFIIAPLIALVELIFARVTLEFIIALFRIMENTGDLVRQGEIAQRAS